MSQKHKLGTNQECRRTGAGTMDRDRDEGTGTSAEGRGQGQWTGTGVKGQALAIYLGATTVTRLRHHLLCQTANASVGHHL